MREVSVQYSTMTGDTMIDGRPFAEVYPTDAGYAAAADWFVRDAAIVLESRQYTRYGIPRSLAIHELTLVDAYRGVPVFAERGMEHDRTIRYILVRPECIFQPYQGPSDYAGVRG